MNGKWFSAICDCLSGVWRTEIRVLGEILA